MDSEPDSRDDVLLRVEEMGVEQVRVVFLDYNGIARARSVAAASLRSALTRGVNFSSPTLDFNSRDLFPPSAAFDLASPDVWARPDPATYRAVPGVFGVAQMYADLVGAEGEEWEGCPRSALRRVVRRAEGLGLHFNVGFEPEGYVLVEEDGDLHLLGLSQFATLDGLDLDRSFTDALLENLRELGLVVEQWSKEYGPGQLEINLRYADPMAAADGLVTFKDTFRTTARQHGLLGTFMPKPFGDQAGSGLHVHLSAAPPDDPAANLFDDPDDAMGLSELARQALGGLLAHGEALTALGASTVNSYKRFLPGSWAPTHVMYAYASRAAFVRIPERETPRRLELRVGDAAGNPYLYLTGILAAMLDGIEQQLDPGPALPGNVGALSADEAERRGARPLPGTLAEALQALSRDKVMGKALGPVIRDEFIKVKMSEWDSFRLHVGEWDREWYLRRY